MKRATITIPDDLESRIDEYTRRQEGDTSLSAVMQAALEEYLERQEVHEPRQPHTVTPRDGAVRIAALSGLGSDTNHAAYCNDEEAVDLPRFLMLDDLTQDELDHLDRYLDITPAKHGSGFSDVSINHDKYLAEDE